MEDPQVAALKAKIAKREKGNLRNRLAAGDERQRSHPVIDTTRKAPVGHAARTAIGIELFVTFCTFGFLGGMGPLAAGKGPTRLLISMVSWVTLVFLSSFGLGFGLLFLLAFVVIKLMADLAETDS